MLRASKRHWHRKHRKSKRLDIVLATLNARYAYSSLALRYLQANLGELQSNSQIIEFVIGVQIEVAAQEILAWAPRIVAVSVSIWNVEE